MEKKWQIGDEINGGCFVFDVDETGRKGKMAEQSDLKRDTSWRGLIKIKSWAKIAEEKREAEGPQGAGWSK